MKKFLGVSIAAMLAVTPMLASADTITPAGTSSTPFAGVEVVTSGNNADTGHIASTAYVKGAYNAAIGAVNTRQEQLKNSSNTAMSATVKTVVAAGTQQDQTSDTALVTEAAVRTAIDNAVTAAGGQTEGQVKALIGAAAAGASDGLTGDTTNGTLSVNAGDGLAIDGTSGALEVDLSADKGLQFDATNKTLEIKDGAGIALDGNGVKVGLTSNGGLQFDATNGKTLEVKVDGTTVGINSTSGALEIANGGVSLAKIASADKVQASDTATYSGTALTQKGYVDEKVAGAANLATYSDSTNYTAGTVGAAIKALNADATTNGSVAKTVKDNGASATYSSSETYDTGTVGAALQSLDSKVVQIYTTWGTDSAKTEISLSDPTVVP